EFQAQDNYYKYCQRNGEHVRTSCGLVCPLVLFNFPFVCHVAGNIGSAITASMGVAWRIAVNVAALMATTE
ncbi:MAG: hypothetical protein PVJ24_07100, partial [Methyloceanibacter sp.]